MEAVGGSAGLADVAHLRQRAPSGGVQIGVVEDRNGALPPSSIDTLRTFSADDSISLRPTSVEPVNDSFRRRGSAISGPVVAPDDEVVEDVDDAGR